MTALNTMNEAYGPVVVPPGTSYDDEAQRWACIPVDWQEGMVVLYEKWLRSDEYATEAQFRQRLHADIAADEASNGISPTQAKHLRDVWAELYGEVS